jgi:hypothetical protein
VDHETPLPPAADKVRALLDDDADLPVWAGELDGTAAAVLQPQLRLIDAHLSVLEQTLIGAAEESLPVTLHLRCWTTAVRATARRLTGLLADAHGLDVDGTAVPAWLQRYRADPVAAARDGIDLVAGDLLAEG